MAGPVYGLPELDQEIRVHLLQTSGCLVQKPAHRIPHGNTVTSAIGQKFGGRLRVVAAVEQVDPWQLPCQLEIRQERRPVGVYAQSYMVNTGFFTIPDG